MTGRALLTGALLGLLLAAPVAARAALAVSVKVDREEVALDEVLVLELRVEADGDPSVALPTRDFDFNVVSRGQSRTLKAVNPAVTSISVLMTPP